MKLNTVNVIVISGGLFDSIYSFSDNNKGCKEAEKLFAKFALKHGAKKDDMDDLLDEGFYEVTGRSSEFTLYLTH